MSRVHLKRVKGKNSYFIGKAPLPDDEQNLTEIEDQQNDSLFESIRMPPQRDPSFASLSCQQELF